MENDSRVHEPSIFVIKALIIMDSDGNRLIAKYYDDTFANLKEQKAFERNLFAKTSKSSGEIILIDGLTCVYKSNVDLHFYVAGSSQENEVVLTSVLNCLYESAQKVLGKSFEKRAFMDNMDSMFLVVDEIVDGGGALLKIRPGLDRRIVFQPDRENPCSLPPPLSGSPSHITGCGKLTIRLRKLKLGNWKDGTIRYRCACFTLYRSSSLHLLAGDTGSFVKSTLMQSHKGQLFAAKSRYLLENKQWHKYSRLPRNNYDGVF